MKLSEFFSNRFYETGILTLIPINKIFGTENPFWRSKNLYEMGLGCNVRVTIPADPAQKVCGTGRVGISYASFSIQFLFFWRLFLILICSYCFCCFFSKIHVWYFYGGKDFFLFISESDFFPFFGLLFGGFVNESWHCLYK